MAFDPKAFLAQDEAPSKGTFDVKAFLAAPSTQLKASTQETLANQASAEQAIREEAEKSLGQRIAGTPALLSNLLGELFRVGKEGYAGIGEIAQKRTGLPLNQSIAEAFIALNPYTALSTASMSPSGRAIQGDVAQSALEGTAEGVVDIADLIGKAVGKFQDFSQAPMSTDKAVSMLAGPLAPFFTGLTSRELTPEQVQQEIEKQLSEKGFQEGISADAATKALGINLGETQPAVKELVRTFGQPEAPGVALAGAAIKKLPLTSKLLKSIASPIKTIENVGLRANVNSLASDFIKPTGEALTRNFTEAAEAGDIAKGFQSVKQNGAWSGTRDFIEKGEGRLGDLGKKINAFTETAEGFEVDGSSVARRGLEAINDPLLIERNPEIIARIQQNAEAMNRRLNGKEVFDRLTAFNDRHEGYFKKSALGQNTALDDAEFASDMAMRRELSKQADSLIKGLTGVDDNFFREYGAVSEIVAQAKKRYADLFVKRGQEVSRGIYGDFVKNFDLSKPLSSLRQPIQFLKGGELGRVDKVAKKISDRLPSKKAPDVLSEAEIRNRLRGVASPIAPPIPQTLSDLIEAQVTPLP